MLDPSLQRLKLQAFLTAVIASSISTVFLNLVSNEVPLLSFSKNGARIADLAYHLAITHDLWTFGQNPYTVAGQLATTSRLAGAPFETAMPVGQLPPAFFLLWPFAVLAQIRLEVVCCLWTLISIGILAWPLSGLILQLPSSKRKMLLGFMFSVPLLSVTGIHAIFLGQTALLATGTLLLLTSCASAEEQRRLPLPGIALLLWSVLTLSLKPYYLLLGAFTLVAFRRWSWLVGAGLLWLIFSVLFTLRVGDAWLTDYATQLHAYTSSTPPIVYGSTINPSTMISVRNAFRNFAPDHTLVATACGLTIVGLMGALGVLFSAGCSRSDCVRRRLFTALATATASILLFSPQLGAYEDLLLLYLLALPLLARERSSYTRQSSAAILLLVAVVFNRPVHLTAEMALYLWSAKTALACIVIHSLQQLPAIGEK